MASLVIMTFGACAPPRSGRDFVAEACGGWACGNEIWIERLEIGKDGVERYVRIGAAVLKVLHVAAAGLIERMKQAVVDAVEVERLDPGALAQNLVEGRRALHPFPVDLQLGVGVPDEGIADLLLEPLRGEMVAHIGIAGPRRNAGRARGGGEQRRLADAKAPACAQH